MSRLAFVAAAAALGILSARSAAAQTVNFDPSQWAPQTFTVPEDPSVEPLTVNIVGYGFEVSSLGTSWMNEEPPWTGIFASDSVAVSNSGEGGTGVITLTSADMPWASSTCNGAPDESQPGTFFGATVPAGHCYLDLQLANSGGMDLLVDVYSPAGDPQGVNYSDSITLTVPEPASMALFGVAIAGFGLVRRRRG